jgi:AcrR family transcriptional regulator
VAKVIESLLTPFLFQSAAQAITPILLTALGGVSRGSFYWHFRDVDAFRAAVLARWREVATERVIADLDALADDAAAVPYLLRRAFRARPSLEVAVRGWAAHDAAARKAVRAIDQRRLSYIEILLKRSGSPAQTARARAQILYWAYLGFLLSDKPLGRKEQDRIIEELIRLSRPAACWCADTGKRSLLTATIKPATVEIAGNADNSGVSSTR